AAQHRHPRTAARIAAEGLVALPRQLHHAGEAVLLHVDGVLVEARLPLKAVLRTADRPVENEPIDEPGPRRGQRCGGAAAHARADDVGAREAEVREQPPALPRVALPRDPLDAAARLPRLAAIEDDAGEARREVIEQLDLRV